MPANVPEGRVTGRAPRPATGVPQAGDRASSGRVAHLDGIRGIAVLLVVLYHASVLHLRLPFQVKGGYIGVDMFFALSGYVITSILIRRNIDRPVIERYRRFMTARFHRLYPALLAMLGGILIATWAGWRPEAGQSAAHVTKLTALAAAQLTTFALAMHPTTPNIVGLTWTLSIEWIFYAMWPFVLWWFLRSRRAWELTAALAVAVYAVSFLIPPRTWWVLPPGRMAQLLAGAAVALYLSARVKTPPSRSRFGLGVSLGLAAVLAWSVLVGAGPAYYGFRQLGAPIVTWAALAMIVGGNGASVMSRVLGCRPLAAVGRVSYSLYLVHRPWMYVFGGEHGKTTSWLDLLWATGAIAATCVISYRLFERPYLRRSHEAGALVISP